MPIQLLLLHVRRYQVLLIFWYILAATVSGGFMSSYGASSLFLAPEYLGDVNGISTAIVGFCVGVFIMSWNITTFILHSKDIRFLATTAQPFLKYCINNSIIPLLFLCLYLVKAVQYVRYQELTNYFDIILLVLGFIAGLILSIVIAIGYFFGADKTIYNSMATVIDTANVHYHLAMQQAKLPSHKPAFHVHWFLSARLHLRKPRDVRHYSETFLDAIFKRHHLAAVLAIFLAFALLIVLGFFLDNPTFQFPAAASITVLFAILIAVSGAITLFLRSWSIPVLLILYFVLNYLYQHNIIDARNKAYGIDYKSGIRSAYMLDSILQHTSVQDVQADKQAFKNRLVQWKQQQTSEKPILYVVAVSGGGVRSASFTMQVMQALDSISDGNFLKQTVLITGASGGMLGAAYYRELFLQQQLGKPLRANDPQYAQDIANDLLNPLFSSFISRDLVGPARKFTVGNFTYVKDRGYAFEAKLNQNTRGLLQKHLQDYRPYEDSAIIPTLFFNSVITADGRKMLTATRPARFMMQALPTDTTPVTHPDVIDFQTLFARQQAPRLGVLTALRMNATFPYVLPNVWLPTQPVIDVMDAGLRDNTGAETAMRFLYNFKDWIVANTSGVVLIQIRDRVEEDWATTHTINNSSLADFFVKPLESMQHNWFNLQDFYQAGQWQLLHSDSSFRLQRLVFQYAPVQQHAKAALSFHLTTAEKKDITASLQQPANQQVFQQYQRLQR